MLDLFYLEIKSKCQRQKVKSAKNKKRSLKDEKTVVAQECVVGVVFNGHVVVDGAETAGGELGEGHGGLRVVHRLFFDSYHIDWVGDGIPSHGQ